MLVDLDLFKKHCRADDLSSDDAYLSSLLESAQAFVLKRLERTEEDVLALGSGVCPADIRHAILLLGAHWYNMREAAASGGAQAVPYGVDALLTPYEYVGGDKV